MYELPIPKVFARIPNHRLERVPVINPGEWSGYVSAKVWLVEFAVSNWPLFVVVEADTVISAIDEVAEHPEYSHLLVVDDENLDDYPEDARHYGSSGQILDLDNMGIRELDPAGVWYHGDHLPPDGMLPKEYEDWIRENGDFETLWGPLIKINEKCRMVEVKYPIEIEGKRAIRQGSFVQYKYDGNRGTGRVMGVMVLDGLGEAPSTLQLVILHHAGHHGFLRVHAASDIVRVWEPNDFDRWFYSATQFSGEEILAWERYGSLSDGYIGRYLDPAGNLVPFAEKDRHGKA